ACRSRQPAGPIELIARSLLPSSRSEAVSSRRIHSGLWPEIRLPLFGTRPSWTFATAVFTLIQLHRGLSGEAAFSLAPPTPVVAGLFGGSAFCLALLISPSLSRQVTSSV